MSRTKILEKRLVQQLAKDRAKPSRCSVDSDGTVVVQISGISVGLAWALSQEIGESEDSILERLAIVASQEEVNNDSNN